MRLPKRFEVDPAVIEEKMIQKAITAAGQFLEENPEPLVQEAKDVEPSGATFTIPVVVPEDTFSGDGRIFKKNAIDTRDLPLPLMWQINTDQGHDGSVVVGRIDTIDRIENGLGNAQGVFDVGVYGREAERLVRNGMLRGISGDFDKFEASTEAEEEFDNAEDAKKKGNKIKNETIRIDSARLMGVTLVAKPAFQECFITLNEDPEEENEAILLAEVPDGEYGDEDDQSAIVASGIPVVPPHSWFTNPDLDGPTPLTVDDDGRVYGHLATWNSTHIGMAGQVRPPRSASGYQYFRSGVVRTDDGTDVTVGQLTLTHGHADTHLSAMAAKNHYDNTQSAVVDVVAGEDQFGIWLAGALRPEVTPQQVRALRASGISGDWRPINGRLELVAACCVNVAGFPTARAMVAGGQVQALVAAGSSELIGIKQKELSQFEILNDRLSLVENIAFSAKAEELSAEMAEDIAEFNSRLERKAQELAAEFDM